VQVGHFVGVFTTYSVGTVDKTLAYMGTGEALGLVAKATVSPAPLAKEFFLLQCPMTFVIDLLAPLSCTVRTFDAYSNVQGAELNLNALEVVGYADGGEEFTLELKFVKFGVYEATFDPVISGLWSFNGFYVMSTKPLRVIFLGVCS
jgi:hypothetical protein